MDLVSACVPTDRPRSRWQVFAADTEEMCVHVVRPALDRQGPTERYPPSSWEYPPFTRHRRARVDATRKDKRKADGSESYADHTYDFT